jgi:xanthine dehydrogenase molybdopterin binding subunit
MNNETIIKHLTGESVYVNDIGPGSRLLYGHLVYSRFAAAKIRSVNYQKALAVQGIKAILSFRDIPGENQIGPVYHDEVCLAENEVGFIGQAILLIAAETREAAQAAEKFIEIDFDPSEFIIDLETSIKSQNRLHPPKKIECGDLKNGFAGADFVFEGSFRTGGQEHWYLETQSSLAIPGEGREMKIFSSTQHPSETQAIVARVLGIQTNEVEVEVRRMGGAFGGKETQANHIAAWAALLANATGCPVKIHLNRDEDQIITGKRHDSLIIYKAGFNKKGKIIALEMDMNLNAGSSSDLTMAILERAMFHADNAYYIPNMKITGHTWKTNLPSNTAMRGFGAPQAMAAIENIIDRIARFLKKDSSKIRKLNFYKVRKENITHYGQKIENNRLQTLYDQLVSTSEYVTRRKNVSVFNRNNEYVKRGLALTPVKFGISFTTTFLNQAGALVNIYRDGTVQVNHGGTEMGQGLYSKIQQIASSGLGIDPGFVRVMPANTSKVPNTSATAASSGTDLNGMAVMKAVDKLKSRLKKLACSMLDAHSRPENLVFRENQIFNIQKPGDCITFQELISNAYIQRISLSATGFYKTPGISFDKETGQGKPFHYYAFGMAVSETEVDILTGTVTVLRTDILHDAGKSLNEAIDMGQIEGGFVQGMGWVLTEDLKYDVKGNLLNHSPDTYKIPTIRDIPDDFRVALLQNAPNPNTIRQSKAVGEPPFMLALSVWMAVKDAISAVSNHTDEPDLSIPATNEAILHACGKLKDYLQ